MRKYKYFIIGGGMTADSAVLGIREVDKKGEIGLISAEANSPYDRPPLTKGLWKGDTAFDEIWRSTADNDVELHLSRTIQQIDPAKKQAVDDNGDIYQYQKLLLATGGKPRHLPNDLPEIIYYRTVEDYKKLAALAEAHRSFGVIGGGFIGAEIAAALAMKGRKVTMVFPEAGLLGLIFPQELSQHLNSYYKEKSVTTYPGESAAAMKKVGERIRIQTNKNRSLTFDAVVAGIGIIPNVEIAQSAGLKVENGIVVDRYLRTSNPDIFAAGDVANFESPHLGKRIRVEHEDNANTMGRHAGRNMAGKMSTYDHLPFFYSDLFELGYEAVGEVSAKLETVVDWKEEFEEGVIYYLSQGRVRGVLLWNVWEQVDAARDLIAEEGPFDSKNVLGLLPKEEEA